MLFAGTLSGGAFVRVPGCSWSKVQGHKCSSLGCTFLECTDRSVRCSKVRSNSAPFKYFIFTFVVVQL